MQFKEHIEREVGTITRAHTVLRGRDLHGLSLQEAGMYATPPPHGRQDLPRVTRATEHWKRLSSGSCGVVTEARGQGSVSRE